MHSGVPYVHDGECLPLYRCFRNEEHARALLYGNVFISTLGACRKYEDSEQGDAQEGILVYQSGSQKFEHVEFPSDNLVMKNLRGVISGAPGAVIEGLTIGDVQITTRQADAWIICTSLQDTPDLRSAFGQYCVKINCRIRFLHEVLRCLLVEREIQRVYAHGSVVYAPRLHRGAEPPPDVPPMFLKPAERYAHQREYRYAWFPKNSNEKLEPFMMTKRRTLDPASLFEKQW